MSKVVNEGASALPRQLVGPAALPPTFNTAKERQAYHALAENESVLHANRLAQKRMRRLATDLQDFSAPYVNPGRGLSPGTRDIILSCVKRGISDGLSDASEAVDGIPPQILIEASAVSAVMNAIESRLLFEPDGPPLVTSKYHGVTYNADRFMVHRASSSGRARLWMARLMHGGRQLSRSLETEEQAALQYNEWVTEHGFDLPLNDVQVPAGHKTKTSIYDGVYRVNVTKGRPSRVEWYRKNPWVACIRSGGVSMHKQFPTERQAAIQYDTWVLELGLDKPLNIRKRKSRTTK